MTTISLGASRSRTSRTASSFAGVSRIDAGLALLRVVVGLVFMAHGGQKLFVFGLDGVAAGFGQMGIPFAGIVGPLVAAGELLGGFALITGVFTRLAALGLSIIMVGAVFAAHLPAGFFLPNGYEFALTLFAASAALALTGAGRYSVDRVIARSKEE
jgi:putative oxidoreductase